jgi:hypothetical protein
MAENNHHDDSRAVYGDALQSRRDFLQVNLGHLLILITMLASAVWWFIIYDREINQTKMVVQNMVEAEHILSNRVDSIDSNGTHFSQHNIDKELETIKNTSERVSRLEHIYTDVLQRTDKMTWQINSISDWVEDQKKKSRSP